MTKDIFRAPGRGEQAGTGDRRPISQDVGHSFWRKIRQEILWSSNLFTLLGQSEFWLPTTAQVEGSGRAPFYSLFFSLHACVSYTTRKDLTKQWPWLSGIRLASESRTMQGDLRPFGKSGQVWVMETYKRLNGGGGEDLAECCLKL